MKKYYLTDYDHGRPAIRQDRIYKTASQIVLKYGAVGNKRRGYTDDRIREFWYYTDDYPSARYLQDHVKYASVKWYIHHKTSINEPIWSADFLMGLLAHCKIIWNKKYFPTCEWQCNKDITVLLESCPYGGKIVVNPKHPDRHRWVNVPALYLKFDDTSLAYMAGVLAGLKLIRRKGVDYAMFHNRALPYFKKWGIPIEQKIGNNRYLISPLWPALFVSYMPLGLTPKWLGLKNPCNVDIYGPVLWKTYINSEFGIGALPYMKSRRTIYYTFECEEGAMKKLDKLRVEKNLTGLDNRIKTIVKEWSENERD